MSGTNQMELGLTIPLQRHLHAKALPYGQELNRRFCWIRSSTPGPAGVWASRGWVRRRNGWRQHFGRCPNLLSASC